MLTLQTLKCSMSHAGLKFREPLTLLSTAAMGAHQRPLSCSRGHRQHSLKLQAAVFYKCP